MREPNFFRRLIRKLRPPSSQKGKDHHDEEMLRRLLQAVERTREVEYSCEDVYRVLDEYAERLQRGEDAARLMPLVRHHLEMCPDCREEFEALLRVLEGMAA
ncbi:MAG: hypothetical protein D6770_06705 [Anaerolineae bacterium]|nr:MAG: hypothetical protein D6770_06705 [Anaerolineae bacterium]